MNVARARELLIICSSNAISKQNGLQMALLEVFTQIMKNNYNSNDMMAIHTLFQPLKT